MSRAESADPPSALPPGVSGGIAEVSVELGCGPLVLWARWTATPRDVAVTVYGGEAHVGAVALAVPRPSLRDPARRSATSSVLTVVGHDDDVVARSLAEALAARLGRNVAVAAGVHIGPPGVFTADPADIAAVVASVAPLAERIAEAVAPTA